MWQFCAWQGINTKNFSSVTCDSTKGASGGPLYKIKAGNKRIIYGVWSAYVRPHNVATRITSGKWNEICQYVQRDTPDHCS